MTKQAKRGRPAWEPTDQDRARVELAVALGMTQEQVALLLGVSVDSLDRHCRKELDAGAVKANLQVGGALFKKAMGGDTAAQIWWSKTRMGWKETQLLGSDPSNPLPAGFDVRLLPGRDKTDS